MPQLGVNIDHVATVRQARRTYEPDPVWAAALAELGGADGITIHLREDRRHISDRDLRILRQTVTVKLNLEMACEDEILAIACQVKPDQVTLVPEKREEITTEGGLDVCGQRDRVARAVDRLRRAGISVSLFLDPDSRQIEEAARLAADAVELHTGQYALAAPGKGDSPRLPERPEGCSAQMGTVPFSAGSAQEKELSHLQQVGALVRQAGLVLHAGHGLTYRNVRPVAAIAGMHELNIGHSIIARAIMVGLQEAVREMKRLVE
jgi:pyridoxine 5-phosphate synthase